MKANVLKTATVFCTALAAIAMAACSSSGKATQLGSPKESVALTYAEKTDGDFRNFLQKTDDFAAAFAASAYGDYESAENLVVSPVSVFMALSLAAECADGATRTELLNALGVTYDQLNAHSGSLYRLLNVEYQSYDSVAAMVKATNSIWVDERTPVNTSCIDALSNNYYTWSFSADFYGDNAAANLAVQSFIKEQTNGLIDQDFELAEETVFALVNTLYLKEIWNALGDDLPFMPESYDFTDVSGEVTQQQLLRGEYLSGRVHEEESFSTFYTTTAHGYRLKFLLPNEGYAVDDVFTAENLSKVNAIADYQGVDEENKIKYVTRCLFPEFSAEYGSILNALLQEHFGLATLFQPGQCDFGSLTTEPSYCSKIQHIAKLEVRKSGIEGAAVTIAAAAGEGAPAEEEYTTVQEDFVIDRAFGFVLTDANGVTLFSGVVNGV